MIEVNSVRWLDKKELPQEIWKDIKKYEGYYQISNYGRVKSLRTNKILKIFFDKDGYCRVCFCVKENRKYIFVHKLVMETFKPDRTKFKSMPYEDKNNIQLNNLQINHKDENVKNNMLKNLEWCTPSYNVNYGKRNKQVSKNLRQYKIVNNQTQKVLQRDIEGNPLMIYLSISDTAKALKVSDTAVRLCINGINKTCKGYILEKYK